MFTYSQNKNLMVLDIVAIIISFMALIPTFALMVLMTGTTKDVFTVQFIIVSIVLFRSIAGAKKYKNALANM